MKSKKETLIIKIKDLFIHPITFKSFDFSFVI